MTTWALQDAKNRLSEVVERARRDGPQAITRRGERVALIVSAEDYAALAAPRTSLVTFLRGSPLAGSGLELERDADTGREIDLGVAR